MVLNNIFRFIEVTTEKNGIVILIIDKNYYFILKLKSGGVWSFARLLYNICIEKRKNLFVGILCFMWQTRKSICSNKLTYTLILKFVINTICLFTNLFLFSIPKCNILLFTKILTKDDGTLLSIFY